MKTLCRHPVNFISTPLQLHWRLFMEIAELAKRQNKIARARKWYKEVSKLEPTAVQGWLERAKVRHVCTGFTSSYGHNESESCGFSHQMEEECGELVKCQKIMEMGL